MSVAFTIDRYGNAALMVASSSLGQLPASQPNGPNLVRWMGGGLLNLLTVNGSNLGRPVLTTYSHFTSSNRFTAGTFAQNVMARVGAAGRVLPVSMIYPST